MLSTDASLPAEHPVALLEETTLSLGGGSATLFALTGDGVFYNGDLTLTDGIYPGDEETLGTFHIGESAWVTGALHIKTTRDGACDKLVFDGACDLSSLSLEVVDLDNLAPGKIYTILEADTITGGFASSNLTGTPWIAAAHDGKVKLMTGGTVLIIN